MQRAMLLFVVSLGLALAGPGQGLARRGDHEAADKALDALVASAAATIDASLSAVAASAEALGRTYARLLAKAPRPTPRQGRSLARDMTARGQTTGFRASPGFFADEPAAMSPEPSFYYYGPRPFPDDLPRQLAVFASLAETFRAAYESFPFSWVYLTAANGAFCIYPYLPLAEATHNDPPTKQVFYQAADFANRAVGWQSPYLDLAGAGMMITASFPIYDGDALLGVSSRDITLEQLSRSVLSRLDLFEGGASLIMDKNGKLVAARGGGLDEELKTVNHAAGDAILHVRTAEGLAGLGKDKARASSQGAINQAAEGVLAEAAAGRLKTGHPVHFDLGGRRIVAARIPATGWYVVLVAPLEALD